MPTRPLLALAAAALLLAGCGGDADADDDGGLSAADQAACDAVREHGAAAVDGDPAAIAAIRSELGDAGPDDDLSQEISGRMQIVAGQALLVDTGAATPDFFRHVTAAIDACEGIGWEAS